jgi:acetolactate synthase-1/2/3 large subunit
MKVDDAAAEILRREGVEILFCYPLTSMIDAAAQLDIRPILVRQERTGLHMADAYSRLHPDQRVGVFAMQNGPGAENAFGAVAQAYSESAPVVVLPAGYPRAQLGVQPNFNAFVNYQHITKSAEQVTIADALPETLRRAFTQVRNGRPRPVVVEIPEDVYLEEVSEPLEYQPVPRTRFGPDPAQVAIVADVLLNAERPVIYAGQGVHFARAWDQLAAFAELLEAPVTTSLQGKSAFPENHPLSLGSGGRCYGQSVYDHIHAADVIFGIGCSFTSTAYGIGMPGTAAIIQATLDSSDLNKGVVVDHALIGDAALTLEMLTEVIGERLGGQTRGRREEVAARIAEGKREWRDAWRHKLEDDRTPLNPYRVLNDLWQTVDVANTIITHDAGSPRDQLSPLWEAISPQSYIGWGKTTQLGYGLGLAMGAKLARPDKLCINVWGDAAIGMTGMDFETAVRERIPIMSIMLNNFCMAIELGEMQVSTDRFRATDISGDYAALANALGGYGERVTEPDEIVSAIRRGIAQTENGVPVLLEFITQQETEFSDVTWLSNHAASAQQLVGSGSS